ncbi:MAG: hypothetical protein KDB07_06910, partial [Planctomycetes bacterium]|nr:hypothetical protein [Planctomycetota bacterium]
MRTRLFTLLTFALLAAATANAQSLAITTAGANTTSMGSAAWPIGTVLQVNATGFAGSAAVSDPRIVFLDAMNAEVGTAVGVGAPATTDAGGNASFTYTVTANSPLIVKAVGRITVAGNGTIPSLGANTATAGTTPGQNIAIDTKVIDFAVAAPGNNSRIGASTTLTVVSATGTDTDNDAAVGVSGVVVEIKRLADAGWTAVPLAQIAGAWNPGGSADFTINFGAIDVNNNGDIEELLAANPMTNVNIRARITDTGNNVSAWQERTNLTVDTKAPVVTNVVTSNTNIVGNVGSDNSDTSTVVLTFDEALDGATVINTNFTSTLGTVQGGAMAPVWNPGAMTVTLTISPAFAANERPTITTNNMVTDLAGNPVEMGGFNGVTQSVDQIKPTLQQAFLNTQNDTLRLVFDEPMGNPAAYTAGNFTLAQGAGNPGPAMANVMAGHISRIMTNVANDTLLIDLTGGAYTLDEGNTIVPMATVVDSATAPNASETSPVVTIVLVPTLNSVSYDPVAHNLTLTFSKDISRTSLVNNIGGLSINDNTGA